MWTGEAGIPHTVRLRIQRETWEEWENFGLLATTLASPTKVHCREEGGIERF
jgi:hypothetical protein